STGKRIQKLDIEVAAVLEVDGMLVNLKKQYTEKWVKPTGQLNPEYRGNETSHFYNDVPCSQKEYREKVHALIPEDKLKLFTNTEYFNSLKMADRRAVLIGLAGNIDNEEIISTNKDFAFVREILNQNKT